MRDDAALAAALRDDVTTAAVDWESVRRRNRLVDRLESGTGSTTVDELSAALAADDAEPLDRESLRVRLVHVLLPRLADAGAIVYEPARDRVGLGGDRDERSPPTGTDRAGRGPNPG